MRSIIVGTAGHIDHGKTALVGALTGIDTDRLAEEKRRGISIDLGFAHLDLDGVRLGFVDVPGHERFVKNMLAGAGGVDLVMLVVAADESIKPQTREHFDICRLLDIRAGVVVLTKSDLVDAEMLELARIEAEEFVAGSFLEGAPVLAVSAVTGAGLDELRTTLLRISGEAVAKDAAGYLRLPIDRAFTMRGFGTVVTGTLLSGAVTIEQQVEAQPGGRKLRVRGVQVHGHSEPQALAGQRTALNLAGAEPSDLPRGTMLVEPGRFETTTVVDCEFELLGSAKPLRHRAPVHFHAWTAETEAEARLFESDTVKPGARAIVRFLLRDPQLLLPGDRFIVRMFSPVVTIGGGRVLDVAPPVRRKRTESAARLRAIAAARSEEWIGVLVRESRHGMSIHDLVKRTGLASAAIERAAASGTLLSIRAPQPWVLDRGWIVETLHAIEKRVAQFHRTNPLAPGLPKAEVQSRELAGAPDFLLDVLLHESRALVADGDLLRAANYKVELRGDEAEALARIESAFLHAGLAVPATTETLAQSGVPPAQARALLEVLLREGKLIRAGHELVFHRTAVDALRRMMADHKGQRFSVPEFKEWTGVSRKYAIPLLEFLDRERVTRRDGDARVVL